MKNIDRHFIPDDNDNGVSVSLKFTEFGSDVVVTPEQIASVCINLEHSYSKDFVIELTCPSYSPSESSTAGRTVLKHSAGSNGGHIGYPLEVDGFSTQDSLANPYGVGLTYCWSVNGDWTTVTGVPANQSSSSGDFFCNANQVEVDPIEYTIPAGFQHGGEHVSLHGPTTQPSNPSEQNNYYVPKDYFNNLVGCPLNGTWTIKIKDYWCADNGWIFGCSLDLYSLEEEGIELPTSDLTTKLMPNPAKDWVRVISERELRHIDIYDLQGRLLQSEDLNGNESEVNISRLAAGIYCARIQTNEGHTARKLVVK